MQSSKWHPATQRPNFKKFMPISRMQIFQTLEQITSFTRVALEVVDTDGITSDRSDADSSLNRFIWFSKRHANAHSWKHDQAQEVLHRIQKAIFNPVRGQDIHALLNLYLLARTNANDAAIMFFKRVYRLILLLWQAAGRPETMVPSFGNQPTRSCKQWIASFAKYMGFTRPRGLRPPYGDPAQTISAPLEHVSRQTVGAMPLTSLAVGKCIFPLQHVQFSHTAIQLLGRPAVSAAVMHSNTVTGSSLSPHTIIKYDNDLQNATLFAVGNIFDGGSFVSLFLVDPDYPSSLGKASINRLHISDVALRFFTLSGSGGPVKLEDLLSTKVLRSGNRQYIEQGIVFFRDRLEPA